MTIKYLTTALAVAAVLLIGAPPADAKKPLDVDCDVLEATLDAVDDFLDGEGIVPNNLGDLISMAIRDEAFFAQLRDLILVFSGGTIEFTSVSQAVSTIAKCGLIPQGIRNIRD